MSEGIVSIDSIEACRRLELVVDMMIGEIIAYCGGSVLSMSCCFFFNDTATTEIYTLSLHDALPIYEGQVLDELDHALRLYRGDFLEHLSEAWAVERRKIGRAHV